MQQIQSNLFEKLPSDPMEHVISVNISIDVMESIQELMQCSASHAVRIRIFLPSDFTVSDYEEDELLQFYREALHDYNNRKED